MSDKVEQFDKASGRWVPAKPVQVSWKPSLRETLAEIWLDIRLAYDKWKQHRRSA